MRDETIKSLEGNAQQWVGKLNAQDGGKSSRGRKLSDGGARAKFYQAVIEARLAHL